MEFKRKLNEYISLGDREAVDKILTRLLRRLKAISKVPNTDETALIACGKATSSEDIQALATLIVDNSIDAKGVGGFNLSRLEKHRLLNRIMELGTPSTYSVETNLERLLTYIEVELELGEPDSCSEYDKGFNDGLKDVYAKLKNILK